MNKVFKRLSERERERKREKERETERHTHTNYLQINTIDYLISYYLTTILYFQETSVLNLTAIENKSRHNFAETLNSLFHTLLKLKVWLTFFYHARIISASI